MTEKYWSITNAYTDYQGDAFLSSLSIILEFIDRYKTEEYSADKYNRLQLEIQSLQDLNLISIRKMINQFVKFGFIKSKLIDYPQESRLYLDAKTTRRRSSIFSQIIYSYASFSNSVTEEKSDREINFLIKTLEECGRLNHSQIAGLMLSEVSCFPKGYATFLEVDELSRLAIESRFEERKFNQISYLINLLGKLDDIVFVNNELYFEDDAKNIFGDLQTIETPKRDPYLHRLYKNQLKSESLMYFEVEKCMLEGLSYPILVASHIKPFISCSESEAYDPNNGLLLSRTIDSLFDLKYISFADNGSIIFYERILPDVKEFWEKYVLDNRFLNTERLKYLQIHRRMCEEINLKR